MLSVKNCGTAKGGKEGRRVMEGKGERRREVEWKTITFSFTGLDITAI